MPEARVEVLRLRDALPRGLETPAPFWCPYEGMSAASFQLCCRAAALDFCCGPCRELEKSPVCHRRPRRGCLLSGLAASRGRPTPTQQHAGKVCYLAGGPKKSEPARGKREHPLAMVTHRPGGEDRQRRQFHRRLSAPRRRTSKCRSISAVRNSICSPRATAPRARKHELDKAIVEAMAKGKQAMVKGDPTEGTCHYRHFFAFRFCPGARADRQSLRREALSRTASHITGEPC